MIMVQRTKDSPFFPNYLLWFKNNVYPAIRMIFLLGKFPIILTIKNVLINLQK